MSFHFWLSIAIATFGLFVAANAVAIKIEGRIVGGAEAHVSSFPYQVSIRRKSCATCAFEQYASGAIYGKNIIITAASVVRTETAKSLMIVAGTSQRTTGDGLVFPVEEIVMHEGFQQLTMDNDVALLKLKVDLPIGESPTVRALEIADAVPAEGSPGVVAGWGQTSETGEYSETIRNTQVPIVSRETCQKSFQYNVITENMICAGLKEGGSDACKGDAGSPLVVADEMVGLVSWGVGCARPNTPGVYTNVVQLRAWIEATAKAF